VKIDCQFPSQGIVSEFENSPIFVVVDVLRATSTIVTAFMNGCRAILPVVEVEEAFRQANTHPAGTLMGGERGGLAVEGFDLGNSPRDYTASRVKGKTVIFTTTNGSRAFRSLPEGALGVVGSFLNLGAVSRYCIQQERDISVITSGQQGVFSLEDTVCAGRVVQSVRKHVRNKADITDTARASEILFDYFRGDLLGMLRSTTRGRYLREIGLGEDLPFCARVDATDLVPIYQSGRIEIWPSR
jgi:2-phosphosulfolactate phosphatase